MVQGILKRYSRFATPRALPTNGDCSHNVQDESQKPKRVSFDGAEPAKVFEADEWDRSPAAVTLKLTYRDVAELRDLNVSIVRPSPLAMVRTASRRPTKKRTPVTTPPPSSDSGNPSPSVSDTPIATPAFDSSISFGYQYHTFTSQSLYPLLEDVSSSSPGPNPAARSGLKSSLVPDSPSSSPPGLSAVRTPLLKGVCPSVLSSSPIIPSPPLSRSSSPKPAPRSMSPIPLYCHPRAARSRGPVLVGQGTTEAPVSVVLPKLIHPSATQDLKFDKLILDSEDEEEEETPLPASQKLLGFGDMDIDTNASPLASGKDLDEVEPPPTPVVTRKPGKSLMGWEFKRNPLGFGLIRTRPKLGTEEIR